jgi:CheY-like chemotaxis protein
VPPTRPSRILAVDDEPAVRALVVRALEEVGYEVVAVPDAPSGLAATRESAFDLVVTNTFLRSVPGDRLIADLRGLFPDLPILHLDDVKPFGIDALLQAVALALSDRLAQPSGPGSDRL